MNKSKKTLETAVTQDYPECVFELLVVFIISTSVLVWVRAVALMGYFKSGLACAVGLGMTLRVTATVGCDGVLIEKFMESY